MKFNTLQEVIEQLSYCNFKDEQEHPLKNNQAFIDLTKIAELNTLLVVHRLDDVVWVMLKNKPTEIIITNMVINHGTTAHGVRYTAKLKEDNTTWFDAGHFSETELFLTKKELLDSL